MYKDNIIIVGGGSAGWMSASILIKSFPNSNICVIESPKHPPIGVGESTYDGIRFFCGYIGLDEKDFFQYTDASIKLGINFTDFYEKDYGETFLYPFGNPFLENTKWGLDDWLVRKCLYPDIPVTDFAESYFPQAHLVKYNRFSDNFNKEFNNFNPLVDTALHFDAIKFGQWLKNRYCIPRGVNSIIDEVTHIQVSENGVDYLVLGNGEKIYGSLFIDCTGFKSMILSGALKEKFISYEDVLPNNRAWATRIEYKDKEKELRTVTTCTALGHGWVWDIPLWSRLGAGYVYSDKFIDPENALNEFKDYLKSNKIVVSRNDEEINNLDFNDIKMRVGIHERTWVKNVVAIGLSAGFIEPLESNGLFTVYEFLFQLVRALQREKSSQWDIDNYNLVTKDIYDGFVEFIILHYALGIRNDTNYWQHNFNRSYDLTKYDLSKEHSSLLLTMHKKKTTTFQPAVKGGITWISSGLHYHILDPVSMKIGEIMNNSNYKQDMEKYFINLDKKKKIWSSNALKSPTLYEYLKNNYYS